MKLGKTFKDLLMVFGAGCLTAKAYECYLKVKNERLKTEQKELELKELETELELKRLKEKLERQKEEELNNPNSERNRMTRLCERANKLTGET